MDERLSLDADGFALFESYVESSADSVDASAKVFKDKRKIAMANYQEGRAVGLRAALLYARGVARLAKE